MKNLIPILITIVFVSGCSKSFPDPYANFKHSSAEQGYWKEVTNDNESIRELHLHSNGFSVTYHPFETYKDYWGTYTYDQKQDEINLAVEKGNKPPDFSIGTGKLHFISVDKIRISRIRLDSRKPHKKDFIFVRFRQD